jgi:trehalose/maltose transport system substrate-binding protein
MTSASTQKKRAIEASFNPTRPALYEDADIERANPFMVQLKDVFANSVARPSTVTATRYPRVSQQFWDAVHEVMSGRAGAEDAARRLEGRLHLVKRQEWR